MKICKMADSRKGRVKDGDYLEVRVPKNSTYSDLVREASDAVDLVLDSDKDPDNVKLSLFRADGTRVLDHPVTGTGGEQEQWTIRGYLRFLHKSAAQVRVRVGYASKEHVVNAKLLILELVTPPLCGMSDL